MNPLIVVLDPGSAGERMNLHTDLIPAAQHREGITLRAGGHTYPVEVAQVHNGAAGPKPDAAAVHHATYRGRIVRDVYETALLDLCMGDPTITLASIVADLLHLAEATDGTSADEVLEHAAYNRTVLDID